MHSLSPTKIIGSNIRGIRTSKNINSNDLARLLSYSKQHVSRIESGGVKLTASQIISIADALNVNLIELISTIGYQNKI